jgi:WD40-like Beta Propeller Repeat
MDVCSFLWMQPPSQNTSNFWGVTIDLNTGRPTSTPSRITSGDGFTIQPSVTSDGKRLTFNRVKPQEDVYLAEFFSNPPHISRPRRLTLDWMPDNKAVLFTSTRTGTLNIFRQKIDGTSAEMLVFGPEQKNLLRLNLECGAALCEAPVICATSAPKSSLSLAVVPPAQSARDRLLCAIARASNRIYAW